ncbi:MAG: PAS domain-containing protein [Deltaproteobacteria bacterium]|nr:PAS domain-containing protein [Deltaproteobacteria bacterium]
MCSPRMRNKENKGVIDLRRSLDDAVGRLRLFQAHTRGIIFELDSNARIIRLFASDPELLARPASEIPGKTVVELLGPKLGQRHHDAAMRTVQTGQSQSYEYELDVPGGHCYFACDSVAVPGNANLRHAVFWIRDITEQVQVQKKLIRTERLALVGALAAGVAHEVNNPLAYMMLNAEKLQRTFRQLEPDGTSFETLDSVKNGIAMILDGTRHVRHIMGELLELARSDDPIKPVDLSEVVGLALEISKSVWEPSANVYVEAQNLPPIMAHRGRLVQVFVNLLTNAVEAMPDGRCPAENEIVISCKRQGHNAVRVEIRDNGTGISPEDGSRIFDPFFTTKLEGTGLGLTVCQRIVSSFGGDIHYEKVTPQGSLFKLTLQCIQSAALPQAE